MHTVDWFYQVELPVHFMAEHPLCSVLGKAKYGDYFFVYQGTTVIGANSYLINETIPDNCIVFGSSPEIVIKRRSQNEIISMTSHIWSKRSIIPCF